MISVRPRRILLGAMSVLALSNVVAFLAMAKPTSLKCEDLFGCRREGGCPGGGFVYPPCIIQCEDGRIVDCVVDPGL